MSRSYKRAIIQLPGYKKSGKKYANKRVRRTDDVLNGGDYRNVYSSYDICDLIFDLRFGDFECNLPKGAKKTRAGWKIPK